MLRNSPSCKRRPYPKHQPVGRTKHPGPITSRSASATKETDVRHCSAASTFTPAGAAGAASTWRMNGVKQGGLGASVPRGAEELDTLSGRRPRRVLCWCCRDGGRHKKHPWCPVTCRGCQLGPSPQGSNMGAHSFQCSHSPNASIHFKKTHISC